MSQGQVFNFLEYSRVSETIMRDYILQGRLAPHRSPFIIVCDRDRKGKEISLELTLQQLSDIADPHKNERERGLILEEIPNFVDLLDKSQWIANVSYQEGMEIIAEDKKTSYLLRFPNQKSLLFSDLSSMITKYQQPLNIYAGGSFQLDKIHLRRVLVSDIAIQTLDEMVREVYEGKITELVHDAFKLKNEKKKLMSKSIQIIEGMFKI